MPTPRKSHADDDDTATSTLARRLLAGVGAADSCLNYYILKAGKEQHLLQHLPAARSGVPQLLKMLHNVWWRTLGGFGFRVSGSRFQGKALTFKNPFNP